MSLLNIEKKIDSKAEVIINFITQLVRHSSKNWKNSGLMPKTRSWPTKEEMKKLNKP